MNVGEMDKIYLIWLEQRIIEYLVHLVLDDMDSGYINSDELQFYPQDVLFFLRDKQIEASDKLKEIFE